jgi:hypothetical protein
MGYMLLVLAVMVGISIGARIERSTWLRAARQDRFRHTGNAGYRVKRVYRYGRSSYRRGVPRRGTTGTGAGRRPAETQTEALPEEGASIWPSRADSYL